jgi:hemerythrin-like metal-binding protein
MEAAGIHKRLQIVIDNTERYFRREELFLQEWQYPKAEVHASSHKLVLKVLKKIQDSFKPCGLETEWQFAALKVKNILLSHILAEDMQCQIFQSNICERSSSKENMKWCHPH